ncbi:hypothetical protein HUF18_16560 [Thalassolituus sp. ST750PaO-4]|uniref:hypothetical protein n=1 Tax=Thalassolituus sp. ST750PaO-4 TaxID=2742965 RepID=UPI000C6B7D1E|nr:hypothetical protein [Thalassolituus sp. ST750PaO-4]MCA6061396.1 hypothetical protein [Thalassolituus sp. ST750PaO-4]PIQ40436.1 MAG: hypothetical protein COW58_05855 [Thalassolituus sp. CG17_big_fil_post_rev_8_21_14_2_50_53_8]
MMNIIKNAVFATLVFTCTAQAEVKTQFLAMSKTPAPLTEKTSTAQTQDNSNLQADTSIVVESAGKRFSPLVSSVGTMSSGQKTGLYKGQLMQAENKRTTGKITGAIMVKTSAETLNIQGASETRFGSEFILLSFDDSTELLTALEQLKKRSDVESAELEVNTKRYVPK